MNNTSALIQKLSIDTRSTALTNEPLIWQSHDGRRWRLSEMESSHLVNILRRIVNSWAERAGIAPVPIKNPQAVLNLVDYNLERYNDAARLFCTELIRRLANGEKLSTGYANVWGQVQAKIIELLNSSKPLLLTNSSNSRGALYQSEDVDVDEYDLEDMAWHEGHPSNYGDR